MQERFAVGQAISRIQLFYYSSPNHIFVNTILIQLMNYWYLPPNIQFKLTQISEPYHHIYGEAPFISVNNKHIVKKQQLDSFVFLLLNLEPHRKYEFQAVFNLAYQIAEVTNIFCEYDQNPYYLFVSPWRKFKQYYRLQDKKTWFRNNSLLCHTNDDSLNKQHFLYKCNSLAQIINQYQKPNTTTPESLRIYKLIVYALMKHLKIVQNTLYLVVSQLQSLKEIQAEVQANIQRARQQQPEIAQRLPPRIILHMNVNFKYQETQENKQNQQEDNDQNIIQKDKLQQKLLSSLIITLVFGLVAVVINK